MDSSGGRSRSDSRSNLSERAALLLERTMQRERERMMEQEMLMSTPNKQSLLSNTRKSSERTVQDKSRNGEFSSSPMEDRNSKASSGRNGVSKSAPGTPRERTSSSLSHRDSPQRTLSLTKGRSTSSLEGSHSAHQNRKSPHDSLKTPRSEKFGRNTTRRLISSGSETARSLPDRRRLLSGISPSTSPLLRTSSPLRSRSHLIDSGFKKLFEAPLTAMIQTRSRMEDVISAQRHNEDILIQSIRDIMRYYHTEQMRHKEKVERLEEQLESTTRNLKSELQERLREQQLFAEFRREGSSIIMRLKDSLENISDKYRQEKAKVMKLEQLLEEERRRSEAARHGVASSAIPSTGYGSVSHVLELESKVQSLRKSLSRTKRELYSLKGGNAGNSSFDNSRDMSSELDGLESDGSQWDSLEVERLKSKLMSERELRVRTEQVMEERIEQYRKLIEDEENVIDSLQEKLQAQERENQKLKAMLDCREPGNVVDLSSSDWRSVPQLDSRQLTELYNELQTILDRSVDEKSIRAAHSASVPLPQKVTAQHQLIQALLNRLRAEERERLKTEEQTAEMLAEEEKTIAFLERKVKGLKSQLATYQSSSSAAAAAATASGNGQQGQGGGSGGRLTPRIRNPGLSKFDKQIEFIQKDIEDEMASVNISDLSDIRIDDEEAENKQEKNGGQNENFVKEEKEYRGGQNGAVELEERFLKDSDDEQDGYDSRNDLYDEKEDELQDSSTEESSPLLSSFSPSSSSPSSCASDSSH